MSDFEKQSFINFLRETLIPDLIDSGTEATAEDFIIAVLFLENPSWNHIDDKTMKKEFNKIRRGES